MSKLDWGKVRAENRIKRHGSEPIGEIPPTPTKKLKKKSKAAKKNKTVKSAEAAVVLSNIPLTKNEKSAAKCAKMGKLASQNSDVNLAKGNTANQARAGLVPKRPRAKLSAEAIQEKRLADAAATAKKVVVERRSLPSKKIEKSKQTGHHPNKEKTSAKEIVPKPKNKPLSVPPLKLKHPDAESAGRAKSKKRRKVRRSPSSPPDQPSQNYAPTKLIDYAKFVEAQIPRVPQMPLHELRSMWANCIRASTKNGDGTCDPVVLNLMEAIENSWNSRVQGESYDEGFKWPDTYANAGKNKGFVFDQPNGMFSYLEYRVGKTNGQSTLVRRAILIRMFEAKLPFVFDKDYMDAWGEHKTGRRLRKMAESLASFARNLKRHENEKYDEAIRDWEADLRFLHERYYVRLFSFGWPST